MKNQQLIEKTLIAIGWHKRPDGIWLNPWGADVKELPDLMNPMTCNIVVVESFQTFGSKVAGTYSEFEKRFSPDMAPEEICKLAIEVVAYAKEMRKKS